MTDKLTRWSMIHIGDEPDMEIDKDGDWVDYDDVVELVARLTKEFEALDDTAQIKRLTKERDRLRIAMVLASDRAAYIAGRGDLDRGSVVGIAQDLREALAVEGEKT